MEKITLKQVISKALGSATFTKEWVTPDTIEIPYLRRKAGLTQEELAKKAKMKQPAISRLENNFDSATLKTIGKIAYALGYRAELKFTKIKS